MAGWMSWFAHAVAGSLYALGFGSFTVEILRVGGFEAARWAFFSGLPAHAPEVALGILVGLAFLYINFRGASETGLAGAIVTVAKILVILLFVAGGLWILLNNPGRLETFRPFAPNGLQGVFLAMGITYVAFEGFEVIVQAGEETKDPKRNIFVVSTLCIWYGDGGWITFLGIGIFLLALFIFLIFTFRAVDHQVGHLVELGVEGLTGDDEARGTGIGEGRTNPGSQEPEHG